MKRRAAELCQPLMEASVADLRDALMLIGAGQRKRLRALLRPPPVPDGQASLSSGVCQDVRVSDDGLVAFLTARLDEDEAAAKAWLPPVRLDGSGSWHDEVGESSLGPYSIEHARLHDPARVLREVAVKRHLLAMYEDANGGYSPDHFDGYWDAVWRFAAAYRDHPDCRQEWDHDRG